MGEKTPWDGAAGKASIRIETGAALQAANACHDVIAVLKGCQDLLKPGALNNYSVDAIGGEEVHAKPLRDKFIEETTQASDTVGKFIDALHDMGDMFKAAGAVYTGNDSLTASEIAALNGKKDTLSKVSTSPAGLPLKDTVAKAPGYLPPHYQTPGGNYTVYDDDIDVAKKPSAKTALATAESSGVFKNHAREPSSMSWKDLQNLGRRIQWSQVSADMPTWKVMAEQVEKVGNTFETAIGTITTTNWESKGGDAALTAVKAFVGSLGSLRDGFTMMHSALQYTVDFLHATAASMPPPADGETCDDVGEVQELYRKHYYVGFDEVQTMFPAAAVPTAPKGALGPPPEKKETDPSKRNDGGGNNQGGNNQGGGNQGGGNQGGGNQGGGNQGSGQDKQAQAQQQQQLQELQDKQKQLTQDQQALDKQKQQLQDQAKQQQGLLNGQQGSGQGGTGTTGSGSGGSGSGGSGSASKGTSSASGSSSDGLSTLMSTISGVLSSVTQALPSVIEALSSIDVGAMTPDLSELTKALGQFPDLATAISDSPEFAQLMADHPELQSAAQALGLTVEQPATGSAATAAAPAAGIADEPVTTSASAAFPRAALPDFSNLSSLEEIVSPLVAASAESAAHVIPEVVEAVTVERGTPERQA